MGNGYNGYQTFDRGRLAINRGLKLNNISSSNQKYYNQSEMSMNRKYDN